MNDILSSRTFGIEIECLLPRSFTRQGAAAELSRRIGLPVDHLTTVDGRNWHIHSDASVHGDGVALEFVSPFNPPLKGQNGLDQVAAVANALRDMGAVTNYSCGIHVHIGTQGEVLSGPRREPMQFAKNIIKLYGRFEAAIDETMAASRRGNQSGYAMSVGRIAHDQIDASATLDDLAQRIQRTTNARAVRYHKVNVTAYAKHRTIEFRQHGGDTRAPNLVNWIIRILQIADAAREGRMGAGPQIARDFAHFAHKTRAVVEMISRPEGATLREICLAHGFRKISVKRQARLAGVAYRKGRGQRYFKIAADASPVVVPPTLEGLDEVLKATPEQREFWKQRREQIARALADAQARRNRAI